MRRGFKQEIKNFLDYSCSKATGYYLKAILRRSMGNFLYSAVCIYKKPLNGLKTSSPLNLIYGDKLCIVLEVVNSLPEEVLIVYTILTL